MTGSQLKALRIQRQLTQPQLAEFLGETTASTVSKWEKDTHPIPQWVQDKMLASTEVSFPLDLLQKLMVQASQQGIDFADLLKDAILAYLNTPKSLPGPGQDTYIADPDNHLPEPKIATDPAPQSPPPGLPNARPTYP